jgi:hypothetical protein
MRKIQAGDEGRIISFPLRTFIGARGWLDPAWNWNVFRKLGLRTKNLWFPFCALRSFVQFTFSPMDD